jgi:serine/threonine protein phosphatase PrpC
MINAYGMSLAGKAHEKRGDPCQDAYKIMGKDDFRIAAVADGLGSELYSGTASKIAVKEACDYCMHHVILREMSDADIWSCIRESFRLAKEVIEKTAIENNHPVDQYDTTLSLALLADDTLYFGHVGDSGILALTREGRYEPVTEQQRDELGGVYPLCFETRWVFGIFPGKVASVLLVTDGMLEILLPRLLENEANRVYTKFARYLMDNRGIHIEKLGEENVKQKIETYIQNIPANMVDDDKTVVCLINTGVAAEEAEFLEPDWESLAEKHNKKKNAILYPDLSEEDLATEGKHTTPGEKQGGDASQTAAESLEIQPKPVSPKERNTRNASTKSFDMRKSANEKQPVRKTAASRPKLIKTRSENRIKQVDIFLALIVLGILIGILWFCVHELLYICN